VNTLAVLAFFLVPLSCLGLAIWSGYILWTGVPVGELKWMWHGPPSVRRDAEPFFYWFAVVSYITQIGLLGFVGFRVLLGVIGAAL
jgi:hypothetical protein